MSGIKDWREEIQHLKNQLSDDQVGCPGPVDQKQQKRDTRKIVEQISADKDAEKEEEKKTELFERKKVERKRARKEGAEGV